MALPTLTVSLAELLSEDGEGLDLSDRIVNQAGQCLCDAMRPEIRETIKGIVEQKTRETVAAMIDKVFEQQMKNTDAYGNPKDGETFTMTELILRKVNEYLCEKVTANGNKAGYGDQSQSRLIWMAATAAKLAVEKELAPAIKAAQDEVKAQIGNKLAAFKAALKDAASAFA